MALGSVDHEVAGGVTVVFAHVDDLNVVALVEAKAAEIEAQMIDAGNAVAAE